MPQLDLTTYITQFVWFIGAFLTFYFWMTFDYIPSVKRTFGMRQIYTKTDDSNSQQTNVYSQERETNQENVNAEMQKAFLKAKEAYTKIQNSANTWSSETQSKIQNENFENAHTNYVKAITYTQNENHLFSDILSNK
jgi:hypothetical protein